MTFAELLNKLISEQGISKNYFIKETGIDRSTFYQVLNGKRSPSEAVFSSILHFFMHCRYADQSDHTIQVTQDDLDHLLKAYLSESLNPSQLEYWKSAETFIINTNKALEFDHTQNMISYKETDQSPEAQVFHFLNHQLQMPDGQIDFYLSPELMDRMHMHECLLGGGGEAL